MSGLHGFVDESKRSDYVVSVIWARSDQMDELRRSLRAMRLQGQDALHFKDESDGRRRRLLGQIVALGVSAQVVRHRSGGHQVPARAACLVEVAAQACARQASSICLELAVGDLAADRRTLFAAQRKLSATFEYRHLRAGEEPMLWAADGVAWAWAKGPPWRAMISPMLDGDVIDV